MKAHINKTVVIYGIALAAMAFTIEWLEYRVLLKNLSTDVYIVILAIFFTALGIWVGRYFFVGPTTPPFDKNYRAINSLSITERELEVLELLALGGSNKEIAEQLFVAESTVKTHLINLYKKLNVERRTQAIQKAKNLKIVS